MIAASKRWRAIVGGSNTKHCARDLGAAAERRRAIVRRRVKKTKNELCARSLSARPQNSHLFVLLATRGYSTQRIAEIFAAGFVAAWACGILAEAADSLGRRDCCAARPFRVHRERARGRRRLRRDTHPRRHRHSHTVVNAERLDAPRPSSSAHRVVVVVVVVVARRRARLVLWCPRMDTTLIAKLT